MSELDEIGRRIDAARELINKTNEDELTVVRRKLFEATVELRATRVRVTAKRAAARAAREACAED